MAMEKINIRKEYLEKRLLLPENELNERTGKILENFSSIQLQGIQVLMSYSPVTARKEFDVELCEQLHLLGNPHTKIAWPKLEEKTIGMEAVFVDKQTKLQKNSFGILEPASDETVDSQLVDAVFVPLLAFDLKGYRVGYGKGYYDRYLARCAQDVVKIGFSFFEAVDVISDIDQFDVPLNYCITPMRVYEF